ncbi:MAG: 16S rRNA (guanine(527)-N(7))-methyltransferase RsmG [Oscillospiraceae bacterium]|nr:16S rRNA (guanine(527)-N(7))-methyltransferase RsmG [Oscillospiraceae bacterium]
MNDTLFSIIESGARELEINLPPNAKAVFEAYYDFLIEYKQIVNLTAISGAQEVARLHFLDSLALLKTVNFTNMSVIDVGTGAGFPGLPLKITNPSINLTLLDATGKRVIFLSELCKLLEVNAKCINARAEEAAHLPEFREQYDIVVSRAVARLNTLSELCLPFAKLGGAFIAMKSIDSDEEVDEAKNAIAALGAKITANYDYIIPGTDITHRAVIVSKISETPENYPRRFAKIQKAPL